MSNYLEPNDCEGNPLFAGDRVILVRVPDDFVDDLPKEDKEAIRGQIGNIFTLREFDDYGYAGIDFEYKVQTEIIYHTIWIEPSCLKKGQD